MSIVGKINDFPPFARMAPEYTDPESLPYFLEQVRSASNMSKPVKAVIMDSTVIPGVGNIYASEALLYSATPADQKSRQHFSDEARQTA